MANLAHDHQVTREGARWRSKHASLTVPVVLFIILYTGILLIVPARLAFRPIGAPGTPANLLGIGGLWLWILLTVGGFNQRPSPIRFSFAIFAGSVGVSYIAGHLVGWYQPANVHQQTDQRWQWVPLDRLTEALVSASDRGLLAFAGAAGVLLLTAEGMRSWRDLELVAAWLVRFAAVVAILGIFQYFTGVNVATYIQIPGFSSLTELITYSRSDLNRVVSTAGHPIEFGVISAALLPIALHYSIFNKRFTSWIPTILIGVVVLMSVSRSAILVSAGAMIVLLLGWPNRWRIRLLLVLPFAAVAARFSLPGLLGTIRALFVNIGDDPSITGRTNDYDVFFRAFVENPLVGRGYFTWVPTYFRTLDNQVLVLLLEIGILGTLALLLLVVSAVYGAFQCRRLSGGDARKGHLGLAVAAALCGLSISFFTFDTLAFRQATGVFFLLLGMAGAAWSLAPQDGSVGRSRE